MLSHAASGEIEQELYTFRIVEPRPQSQCSAGPVSIFRRNHWPDEVLRNLHGRAQGNFLESPRALSETLRRDELRARREI